LARSMPKSVTVRPVRRIAHPTDFSPASRKALAWAIRLAKEYQAELVLIHVLPPPTPIFEAESELRPQLESALSLLTTGIRTQKIATKRLLLKGTSSIDKQIVRSARAEQVDLIVMGTRGRTGLSRLLMGSVAARVIARAHCPVLVVRGQSVQASSLQRSELQRDPCKKKREFIP